VSPLNQQKVTVTESPTPQAADVLADRSASDPPDTAAIPPPGRPVRRAAAFVSEAMERSSLIAVWLAMLVIFTLLSPHLFLTGGTMQTIFGSQQAEVFVALAALTAFSVGEFDLSVAATMGLSATAIPVLATNDHVPVALACLVALGMSVAVGAANAFIVVRLGIDSIIATLGMATLVGGISYGLCNSNAVSLTSPELEQWTSHSLLGLPANFWYGLIAAAAFAYVQHATALGRHMLFVASNRSVAKLAGVRVDRIRTQAYLTSSLIAGIGGLLLVGTVGSFDPSSTPAYLLPALSAAFLGTAVIVPGRFNPFGTVIAIYFLSTGIVGLQLLGLAGWVSDVFYGATLIVALVLVRHLRPMRRKP